jgi:hypothetical protein
MTSGGGIFVPFQHSWAGTGSAEGEHPLWEQQILVVDLVSSM